jgi:hypothetical protein
MKRIFILVLFISACIRVISQDLVTKNIVIGVYAGAGINRDISFGTGNEELIFRSRGSYSAGFSLTKFISEKNSIEIAGCYTDHKVAFSFRGLSDIDGRPATETFQTFNIPVTFRHYFGKNTFGCFGAIIDLPIPGRYLYSDIPTGLGFSFGAGKEVSCGDFRFSAAPVLEVHSLLPFGTLELDQRLFILGLRFGLINRCR